MKLQLIFQIVFLAFLAEGQTVDGNLPNSTSPLSYRILITTGVPDAAVRFSGFVSVNIRVLGETTEVYLHSRRHTFPTDFCNVFLEPAGLEPVETCKISRINEDMIRVKVEAPLKVGSVYSIDINYQGNLLLTSEGFFRNDHVSYVADTEIYT